MEGFDPIGDAVFDFHFKQDGSSIYIHAADFDPDEMPSTYFFRSYAEMPFLEQYALQQAKGRVLDVGACAGCHSLHLQNKGLEVVSLERSEKSTQVLRDRGLKQVVQADFFHYNEKPFDTILLLMNGVGIAGTLSRLPLLLSKLKSLLSRDGAIYMDSSDLIYLYDSAEESTDGSDNYYGEMQYQTEYKNQRSSCFPWLYIDFHLLESYVASAGLKISAVKWGDHYDYLATITH